MRHGTKLAIIMSLVAWLIVVVRIILSLEGVLSCYAYVPVLKACTGIGGCSTACSALLATWITCAVLFAQVVPFFLSIVMCIKGQRLNKRRPSVASTDSMISEDRNGVTPQPVNLIQQWRHDYRAMTTVVIFFIALIICTLPPFILYFIQFVIFRSVGFFSPSSYSAVYMLVGSTLLYFQTVADPIVIMRNRDFTSSVKQLSLSSVFKRCL